MVIFELTPSAYLGLVNASGGSLQPTENKGTLLSIETAELEEWWDKLKDVDGIDFIHGIEEGAEGMIQEFRMNDPEGYVIEFFRWRADRPEAASLYSTVIREKFSNDFKNEQSLYHDLPTWAVGHNSCLLNQMVSNAHLYHRVQSGKILQLIRVQWWMATGFLFPELLGLIPKDSSISDNFDQQMDQIFTKYLQCPFSS